MSNDHHTVPWMDLVMQDLAQMRSEKPRTHGITMVMDKGLGLTDFSDLLHTAAAYIDYVKLGFGTSILYPPHILREKIQLAKQYDVIIFPGGTFFEIAHCQGKGVYYFEEIKRVGFEAVEISEGTIFLSRQERNELIQLANETGLHVLTECGKKQSGSTLEISEILSTLEEDLRWGARHMIVEGRESGENVGVYDERGKLKSHLWDFLKDCDEENRFLIWEAPKKEQQVMLIDLFGTQVNLGNISSTDVLSLESLRRGLRADTFHP